MASRTHFTADEDRLLVKYIAKYNPSRKGRAGNALYRRLCEDVDRKWKWSGAHSWQSWRDRYYKNAEEFDRKIKAYQKKHGLPDGETDALTKVEKVVREEAEETEDEEEKDGEEGFAAPGKRKRAVIEEGKRAKIKREPGETGELMGSERREQRGFVMGKGSVAMAARRDGNVDAQSKPELQRKPTTSDEDRREVVDIVAANGDDEPERVEENKVSGSGGLTEGVERARNKQPSPRPLYPDITKLPAPQVSAPEPASSQGAILPAGYVPAPSISYVVRPEKSPGPQPEASSSKVQLSPSNRIPSRSAIAFQPRRQALTKQDDFFESAPTTPSPPDRTENARPKHRLPVLVEGPFGHRFSGRGTGAGDDSSSEDEKMTTWPPLRKRDSSSKGKGRAKQVMQDGPERTEDSTTVRKSSKIVDEQAARDHIRAAPFAARQVNAHASLTRNFPPPGAILAPIRLKTLGQDEPLAGPKTSSVEPRKESISKSDSVRSTSALSRSTSGLTVPATSETDPSVVERRSARTIPRTSWTPGDPFNAHTAHATTDPESKIGAQNPFSRRHTIDSIYDVQNQDVGRRVDLRAEMAKRLHSRSSSVQSRAHSVTTAASRSPVSNAQPTSPTTTTSMARRRSSLLPIPVADEDRERIEYLGVSKAIEMIAKNFGIRDENVWNAWKVFKNIARTEDFFRRFQEKAKAVEAAVLEEMEQDGVDLDALLAEQEQEGQQAGLPPEPTPKSERGQPPERELGERRRSAPSTTNGRSPRRRTQEPDLKIKPLPLERELSEYTPPYMSRAGQYVRLVKQGRKEEAISREERRASGGSGVFPKLRSQSAAQESPQNRTPDTRTDARRDNNRGEAVQSHNDRSLEQIANEVAAEELLQEEEEMAFLAATSRNASELRRIEQRMDVDYMLRWTAAQLGRFAQMRDRNVSPRSRPGVAGGE